jgi:16S rRNA (adenine1518-N6/adenine1519-N6)-dimethyltransferase
LFDVPPESFDIKPKVNSSFVRLIPKTDVIDSSTKDKLFKIIDMSFASRRKNIKNNLKKANLNWSELDIDQNLRPEEVSLENYLKIAKHYQE